jgi:uroporphyrinogen-III synthase
MKNFLSKKNIELKTINVYEKKISPKKIDFDYDGILFFSPSQIESFFQKNFLKENIIIFCI